MRRAPCALVAHQLHVHAVAGQRGGVVAHSGTSDWIFLI
jgi:hypothetical protein